MIERRGRLALRDKVKNEDHLEIFGKLKEEGGMKLYLNGKMDNAKKLKLRFRVGDLDLRGRRKRYTSKRTEEEEDRQARPCGVRGEPR